MLWDSFLNLWLLWDSFYLVVGIVRWFRTVVGVVGWFRIGVGMDNFRMKKKSNLPALGLGFIYKILVVTCSPLYFLILRPHVCKSIPHD